MNMPKAIEVASWGWEHRDHILAVLFVFSETLGVQSTVPAKSVSHCFFLITKLLVKKFIIKDGFDDNNVQNKTKE